MNIKTLANDPNGGMTQIAVELALTRSLGLFNQTKKRLLKDGNVRPTRKTTAGTVLLTLSVCLRRSNSPTTVFGVG
jgi:hypothetical protein